MAKETMVSTETVDRFCDSQGIEKIDLLKVDTQGYELDVFKGAEKMFRENRVGLFYFEIILSDMYRNLPNLGDLFSHLRARDFLLVSLYRIYHQKRLASWADA
ncbi:MAG TPA: FkbM family methyltransferase, partial [Vicinamibacterales bacterium]|nr:FkbM family methyltransferase [Vicinamibacterales bacterium]